jgi:hypothetical protein
VDSSHAESFEWSWEEALKSAIHLKLSIEEFNEMTPYELSLCAEVFVDKIQSEKEEKLTLVWLGEYYHRMKKLPPLKDELKKLTGNQNPQMSDEDMFKMAERLNLQFGGKVKERGEINGT